MKNVLISSLSFWKFEPVNDVIWKLLDEHSNGDINLIIVSTQWGFSDLIVKHFGFSCYGKNLSINFIHGWECKDFLKMIKDKYDITKEYKYSDWSELVHNAGGIDKCKRVKID